MARIHLKPKRFYFSLDESNLIYEDDDMVVVDKPPGAPVHATLDNWRENVLYRLRHELGRSAFPTHRLDVPTEGLLIFAKSTEAQTEINRLFHDHKVRKIYRAATELEIPPGEYVHYMDMSAPKPPRPLSAQMQPGWSVCRLEVLKSWSLLWENTKCLFGSEILLKTGRTHQIRAQMAVLGAPIWGDALYGSPKKYVPERIALECLSISFTVRSGTIGLYRPTPLVAPQPTKDFAVDPET